MANSISTSATNSSDALQDQRMRAGRLALIVGTLVFLGKLVAYLVTGSTAVLADAMESTINIVSAGMLVFALTLAARPPDRSHPYGHGKIEFLSAGLEGAAIAFAALVILAEGIRELIEGPEVHRLDLGLGLLAASAGVNALLGRHLLRTGQRTDSAALVADGRHVLADVWTSVGVIGGLSIVYITGWVWADPLIAITVALHVASEGYRLVQSAVGGLMDEADRGILESTVARLERERSEAWINLHGLRSWRSGARRHFDLHLTVPRYLDVTGVHQIHDAVEGALLGDDGATGDVVVHFDPCEDRDCRNCAMASCPIRVAALEHRMPFTAERAERPDPEHHAPGRPTAVGSEADETAPDGVTQARVGRTD